MRKSVVYLYPVGGICAVVAGFILKLLLWPGGDSLSTGTVVEVYQRGGDYVAVSIESPIDRSVFPRDIASPILSWQDKSSDAWVLHFEFSDDLGDMSFLCAETFWSPGADEWEAIKERSVERDGRLTIIGFKRHEPGKVLSAGSVAFSTSADSVEAPLFYREVNLPFVEAVKDPSKIRWRFGSVSSEEQPPVVLENLPVCANCHSFSEDASVMGMDVDYANSKGSYVITGVQEEMVLDSNEIITWDEYERGDGEQTFGLLSQTSPDGRYVISTVKDRSVFVGKDDLAFSQLFFPIKGILAYYDREDESFHALPGADDPNFVQSNPSWSPDGEYIVFARSRAYKLKSLNDDNKILLSKEECAEFLKGGKTFKFDLYRIPFNGGKGGKAEPVEGASANGMSNFFAKYSPDGKWIVFCKANNFMLLQEDSELYIVRAEGGEARRLDCNLERMNSWHSWSPNGKWLVFTSKANTLYTQLFLTHIDDDGVSSRPVVLSRFTDPGMAANIPEFVNVEPTAIRRIREKFLDDVSHKRAGDAFLKSGDPINAEREYRKALGLNPNNPEVRNKLGFLLYNYKGNLSESMEHLSQAVRLAPGYVDAHYNLGTAYAHKGDLSRAAVHLGRAIELEPTNARAAFNLGVVMDRQGNSDEAVKYLRHALSVESDYAEAHCRLGKLFLEKRATAEAMKHLRKAVRLKPDLAAAQRNLGTALMLSGKVEEAVTCISRAVELDPKNSATWFKLGIAMYRLGRFEDAVRHFSKAVALDEKDAAAHYQLGQSYFALNRIDEAMAAMSHVIALEPDHSEANYNLGIALILRGRGAEARECLERAAGSDKNVALKVAQLGAEYVKMGQLRSAIVIFEQALHVAEVLADDGLVRRIQQQIESAKRGGAYR